jgi:hypothetical protein
MCVILRGSLEKNYEEIIDKTGNTYSPLWGNIAERHEQAVF